MVGGHVDDFNAVDYPEGADSAFSSFAEFFELLGLRTKETKAQPPEPSTEDIQRALATDALTPEEAHRLAGCLAFLSGQGGPVAGLRPIHDTAASEDARFSTGLRAALRALLALLANVEPRFIPFCPTEVVKAVLYADAFFKEGELRHKA